MFDESIVRSAWNDSEGEFYFAISDVVKFITKSKDIKQYIKKLRRYNADFALVWHRVATPLRMKTAGGMQPIYCASRDGISDIVEALPSRKAAPFKKGASDLPFNSAKNTVL